MSFQYILKLVIKQFNVFLTIRDLKKFKLLKKLELFVHAYVETIWVNLNIKNLIRI